MRSDELLEHLTIQDLRHARYNGYLQHPGYGLYVPGTEGEYHPMAHGTLLALTRGLSRTVSHDTAAALHGLIEDSAAPPFHLTVPRAKTRIRRALVIGHRADIPQEHLWYRGGVPITSPAWTWTDLALNGSLLEGLTLADRVIRSGRPEFGERPGALASREELRQALELRGRANGKRTAAQALELVRDGVDSPQETRLRLLMHRAQLPEPRVNEWLYDKYDRRTVQPDLTLPEWKLAIQYDGEDYHSGEQMRKDVRRTERTEALGWKELRITKDHMRGSGQEAVAKILRELHTRGWRR